MEWTNGCIRMGKWKGVQLKVKHPKQTRFQLFNLDEDPTENNDVSQQFPDVVQQIKQFMDTAHTPSPLFPFKKIDKQKAKNQQATSTATSTKN